MEPQYRPPIYYSPYYRDPHKGTHNFGKPHIGFRVQGLGFRVLTRTWPGSYLQTAQRDRHAKLGALLLDFAAGSRVLGFRKCYGIFEKGPGFFRAWVPYVWPLFLEATAESLSPK